MLTELQGIFVGDLVNKQGACSYCTSYTIYKSLHHVQFSIFVLEWGLCGVFNILVVKQALRLCVYLVYFSNFKITRS